MSKVYDVIILGAGPAGLSAGIYSGRNRVKTLIIEKDKDGGQASITAEIENYPGSLEHETGPTLVKRMSEQVAKFGCERQKDTIIDVDFSDDIKKLIGKNKTYLAKSVILAPGALPRPIGCPGEIEYIGKGVSYCATCDGAFFEDLEVYVVGGGDSAVEEALYLTRFARKVTIVHRRDQLRAAKSIQEKAFNNDKINFLWDTVVKEITGTDGIMNSMLVENIKTKEVSEIVASEEDGLFGLFVFIGFLPNTEIFEGKLDMSDGYIIGDENMHTNVKGVFVAGDCRVKDLRQVITAASDGAIAAMQVEKYLDGLD